MRDIKVKFCDGFYEEDDVFLPILSRHYNVIISDEPDYIIYGPFESSPKFGVNLFYSL